MGAVYSAFDPDLDRKIAIKLLHAERAAGDLLLREAKAMAKLDHPNAVAVHDVGETGGSIFVAMEFIHGVTLRRWLAMAPRSWRAIRGAFVQAGRGLAAAHAKGLVHRDFKPENVMVDLDGSEGADGPARVRVLDFGLARMPGASRSLSDDGAPLDRTDARAGTPAYMAPEQFMGVDVGARSDQFAYCVALYEAVTSTRPFIGSSSAELAANVVSGAFATTSPARPIPGWLRRVVERGLSVDPDLRWPSMDVLLRELQRDPTRRRRLVVGAAIAIAAGGLALGARQLDRTRRLAACDEAVISADAWSESIADEIGDTFARSGVGYATDAWTRARPRLDAFADAWAETDAGVCRDGIDRGPEEPAIVAARTCLEEASARMAAVTDRLRNGSETAIEQSISWAAGLPNPRQCVDDREVARRIAVPRDRASDAASTELRRELFAIDVLVEERRSDEALAAAESALGRAEALGWAPIVAHSRIAWANAITTRLGRELDARAALETAFDEATVAGDDAVALRAALSLAYLLSREFDQPREALIWCRVGKDLAARLGLPPDAPESTGLDAAIGMAHFAAGDTTRAEQEFTRVVDVWRAALGSEHPKLANALTNLGAVALSRGRAAESVALYREAHAIAEAAFGPDHPNVAHTLQSLATGLARAGDLEAAEPLLRRALAIRVATVGLDHRSTVQVQANLAACLLSLERLDETQELLERVVAFHREHDVPSADDLAGALHNLGNLYLLQRRADDAMRSLTESVELSRAALGPEHPETARTLSRLAVAHFLAGDGDASRTAFREAIAILERKGGHEPLLRDVLVSSARVSLRRDDLESAASACERALAVVRALPVESRGSDASMCVAVTLWRRGGDRETVVARVREARAGYVLEESTEEVAALDAWLAASDPEAPPPWDLDT